MRPDTLSPGVQKPAFLSSCYDEIIAVMMEWTHNSNENLDIDTLLKWEPSGSNSQSLNVSKKPTALVKSSVTSDKADFVRMSSCLFSGQTNSPPLRLIYSTTSKSSDDFLRNDRWKVINRLRDACFCSRGEYLHLWLSVAACRALQTIVCC